MRIFKAVTVVLGLVLLACSPSFAQQNALGTTTLASAMTNQTNTANVASATGITYSVSGNQTLLVIDNEAMMVAASPNGTQVTVTRGYGGSRASAHVSGANVLIGRPTWFTSFDPSGSCSNNNLIASPLVNYLTGNQWLCSSVTGRWVPGFGNPGNSGSPIGVTTAVASAAGLVTPSGPLFHITGTMAITGFTLPVGFNGGTFCVIPDGNFTTTNANNIALATTAVTSKTLCWTYDKNAAKPFFPSY